MGLMDVLNGMQNGPRGQRQPPSGSSGGMSPITTALIGLLAYKALKHFGGQQPDSAGRSAGPTAAREAVSALGRAAISQMCSRAVWAGSSRAAPPAAY
jgi:hypothetical protein